MNPKYTEKSCEPPGDPENNDNGEHSFHTMQQISSYIMRAFKYYKKR